VDVYSFAMIIFQLFETTTPFQGHDPVDAARQAAMLGARPGFPPRRGLTAMTQVRARVAAARVCVARAPWASRWLAAAAAGGRVRAPTTSTVLGGDHHHPTPRNTEPAAAD
jgi:hypothetical protein